MERGSSRKDLNLIIAHLFLFLISQEYCYYPTAKPSIFQKLEQQLVQLYCLDLSELFVQRCHHLSCRHFYTSPLYLKARHRSGCFALTKIADFRKTLLAFAKVHYRVLVCPIFESRAMEQQHLPIRLQVTNHALFSRLLEYRLWPLTELVHQLHFYHL